MKKLYVLILTSALIMSCNVNKEEKGDMPELDIDVTADSGELPEYEVNWADVEVGTTTKMVKIPKVVIVMEEEEVEVPVIDVQMPGENDSDIEERTLMVEAEVTDVEHTIDIRKIYAADDNLYVVSELKELEKSIGDKKMRVSDQVVLNAPDMNVIYYIVGKKPEHVFNSQYKYVESMNEIDTEMKDSKVIYNK